MYYFKGSQHFESKLDEMKNNHEGPGIERTITLKMRDLKTARAIRYIPRIFTNYIKRTLFITKLG